MGFLSNINALLVEKLGPLGPLMIVGFLGLVMIGITLPTMLKKRRDPLDKLRDQIGAHAMNPKADKQALRHGTGGADKLEKFANFLEPQDAEELSAARLMMVQAGYRGKNSVRTLNAVQFGLGIFGLILGVTYAIFTSVSGEVSTQKLILSILIPGGLGWYLPGYWVRKRVAARQTEIMNGFPDALDMMLVCVEAGQSIDQSIVRVSKEIRAGFPALADEFEIVANEVKAGKDKIQVMKDMAERAGVADVSSFVTVLIQSATFGTSIAEALRVYASEMRDKRVLRAEEKANVLPTKLTLGTMMFTVPPLMIILIGPSVYGIYETLQGAKF